MGRDARIFYVDARRMHGFGYHAFLDGTRLYASDEEAYEACADTGIRSTIRVVVDDTGFLWPIRGALPFTSGVECSLVGSFVVREFVFCAGLMRDVLADDDIDDCVSMSLSIMASVFCGRHIRIKADDLVCGIAELSRLVHQVSDVSVVVKTPVDDVESVVLSALRSGYMVSFRVENYRSKHCSANDVGRPHRMTLIPSLYGGRLGFVVADAFSVRLCSDSDVRDMLSGCDGRQVLVMVPVSQIGTDAFPEWVVSAAEDARYGMSAINVVSNELLVGETSVKELEPTETLPSFVVVLHDGIGHVDSNLRPLLRAACSQMVDANEYVVLDKNAYNVVVSSAVDDRQMENEFDSVSGRLSAMRELDNLVSANVRSKGEVSHDYTFGI